MKPIKLKINTKTQQYSIVIGSNLVSIKALNSLNLVPMIVPNSDNILI